MRRFLSSFLLLFFGLGPLSAVLPASDDARLPACCRRNGAHHCAMTAEMIAAMMAHAQKDASPGFSAPATCANYPGVMALLMTPGDALTSAPMQLPTLLDESLVPAARRTVAVNNPIRTKAGRGPPLDLLS